MKAMAGLGKKERERLSAILRETKGTISVGDTEKILGINQIVAAKMLSRWAGQGWLSRVRRGLYVPVPLESRIMDVPLEDPWIVASRLFNPCYIGGWSAAEYWDLTEQIFRTIIVITVQRPRERKIKIKGIEFWVRSMKPEGLFGLKPVWRGEIKVNVSDPTRTILDLLADPGLGGGLRSVEDMLINYFKSDKKDLNLLLNYAERLGNGAVYKRLGFLLEQKAPEEREGIRLCRERLTTGNAKLDLSLPPDRLITRWRLWVPGRIAEVKNLDQ
jgi:predicted transcriptional regulator of viral defense system